MNALAEEAAAGTKGGVVKVCTLDQSDDLAVQDFVEMVKSENSQIDLLVNSAFCWTNFHDSSLWQAFLGKTTLCI